MTSHHYVKRIHAIQIVLGLLFKKVHQCSFLLKFVADQGSSMGKKKRPFSQSDPFLFKFGPILVSIHVPMNAAFATYFLTLNTTICDAMCKKEYCHA